MDIMNNEENALFTRLYFEDGCLCINVDKTLTKLDESVRNEVAAQHYHENCTCSRNWKDEE